MRCRSTGRAPNIDDAAQCMLELENGVGTPTLRHTLQTGSIYPDELQTAKLNRITPNFHGRGNGRCVVPRARVDGARGNPPVLAHDLPWDGGRARVPEQPGEEPYNDTTIY